MKLFLLLFLVACRPEMGPRTLALEDSSGIRNESLIGSWVTSTEFCYMQNSTDVCSGKVVVTFTQSTLSFMAYNTTTNLPVSSTLQTRQIRFLSDSMYYDERVDENVTFEVNGNSARLCYDVECENLTRN